MSILGCHGMSSHEGGPGWYALYTRHQHEKVVDRILSSKGFETFLPVYRALRRWKDRNKQLLLPLFPSYLFVRSYLDRRVEIRSTPGVFGFVGTEGRPSSILSEEIESLRLAVESCFRVEPHPFLNCGDRVRITSGPLEGTEGVLIRKKNAYRLVLSIQILGRSAAVEIDDATVEKVSRRNPVAHPNRRVEDFTAGGLGNHTRLRPDKNFSQYLEY
jgi:transcription antitermination factor NusG